jgi:hypothetical protein
MGQPRNGGNGIVGNALAPASDHAPNGTTIRIQKHCVDRWWERADPSSTSFSKALNTLKAAIQDNGRWLNDAPSWVAHRNGSRYLSIHADNTLVLVIRSGSRAITCLRKS